MKNVDLCTLFEMLLQEKAENDPFALSYLDLLIIEFGSSSSNYLSLFNTGDQYLPPEAISLRWGIARSVDDSSFFYVLQTEEHAGQKTIERHYGGVSLMRSLDLFNTQLCALQASLRCQKATTVDPIAAQATMLHPGFQVSLQHLDRWYNT